MRRDQRLVLRALRLRARAERLSYRADQLLVAARSEARWKAISLSVPR